MASISTDFAIGNEKDISLETGINKFYCYLKRGLAKKDSGDYKGAIADYNESILINPYCSDAFNNRGNAKSNLEDYKGAISDYNHAINLNPDNDAAYNNRGNVKSILEDYEEAISDYNHAIKLSPDNDGAYFNLGNVKRILGDYKGAITYYNYAIKLNSSYPDAYNNRGHVKNNLGDYEGAIADCDKSIELNAINPYPYFNRGLAKNELGDYEGAIADYNKAMEFQSFAPYLSYFQDLQTTTRNRLGAHYVSDGKWYEGLAQLQLCLDYYRQTDNLERRADLLTQIARVHLLLGDWDKARMLYRDALRLYSHLDKKAGIANCHLALGRMMLRLNYISEALKELEIASMIFTECGLSDRQAETAEVLEVISQFQAKQALKV